MRDVKRLQDYAGLTKDSRLLDWGCGAGRLAVGVKVHLDDIADYHGVDVQPELIEWASANLGAPNYRDRKSTRLNSSHIPLSRMPSSA